MEDQRGQRKVSNMDNIFAKNDKKTYKTQNISFPVVCLKSL